MKAQGTSDGINNPNGRIISDKWIPNRSDLIIEDHKKVMAENKRPGIRPRKGGKGKKCDNPVENNNKNKAFRKMKE